MDHNPKTANSGRPVESLKAVLDWRGRQDLQNLTQQIVSFAMTVEGGETPITGHSLARCLIATNLASEVFKAALEEKANEGED